MLVDTCLDMDLRDSCLGVLWFCERSSVFELQAVSATDNASLYSNGHERACSDKPTQTICDCHNR